MRRPSKSREIPVTSYDAIMIQAVIGPRETVTPAEVLRRVFGKTSAVKAARVTRALFILYSRRRISVLRAGRLIQEVTSTEKGPRTYMQLEACLFLIIRLGQDEQQQELL